jgi:secreted PhoX family phosphatase
LDDGGTIELVIEPNNPDLLDFPDNLIMAPWGDLLVCEDGWGEQYVVGVTPDGNLYRFARNALNGAEFAGICFSPDGRTMFLNIYSPGITLAVWSDSVG